MGWDSATCESSTSLGWPGYSHKGGGAHRNMEIPALLDPTEGDLRIELSELSELRWGTLTARPCKEDNRILQLRAQLLGLE